MEVLKAVTKLIGALFLICYSYQFLYIVISLFGREKREDSGSTKVNRYAVLICARNEQEVIGDLLGCIECQTYPRDLIDTYVMADNCTDDTAGVAREHGVTVFERHDTEKVGKGYALDMLLKLIAEQDPRGYDGYFVFDADNLLEPDYIEKMDMTFSRGYDAVTGYRNSKNYGSNWLSAGYALWFMRESRFLNYPRHLLGSSCFVSGTGFMFSREIAEEMKGWPYHTLTEDMEFTVDQILRGRRVAYCRDAVLYDEQPVRFSQSWNQRMRWSRGFLQVARRYGSRLLNGAVRGKWSCIDCMLNIMPAYVLSSLSVICNLFLGISSVIMAGSTSEAVRSIASTVGGAYILMFALGALTAATEWNSIGTTGARKIASLFSFPLFMATYVPISLASLFTEPGWKPIEHIYSSRKLAQLGTKGAPLLWKTSK